MSAVQISNPGSNPNIKTDPKSLSFDEVSKLFSLPLSDAADTLGVCTSVLKKICYENGLVRWPYRKVQFLSGKSIEEIKKDAAKEKQEQHAELPKPAGEKPNLSANSTPSSSKGSPLQNKGSSAAQEMPKSAAASQQQGSKTAQTLSSQHLLGVNLPKGTTAGSDEFKYGFPSDGLSAISYKWWGSRSTDANEDTKKEGNAEESKQQSAVPMDESAVKTDKSNVDSFGADSLSDLRKQAAKEGKEALKLGVYREHSLFKLDLTKRKVLLQVFKSAYPPQWEQE
nr:protein NLP2 [Ipomoea batatas]